MSDGAWFTYDNLETARFRFVAEMFPILYETREGTLFPVARVVSARDVRSRGLIQRVFVTDRRKWTW